MGAPGARSTLTPDGWSVPSLPQPRTKSFEVDARDAGAKFDGVTDDTAALQIALSGAAGGTLLLPRGAAKISAPLVYNCATQGPLRIAGQGAGTEIRIHGAADRAFHFTGVAGATIAHLQLAAFAVASYHDTLATDGILLDGLAVYSLEDVIVLGRSKMGTGIRLRGTQQGQISGGFLFAMQVGVLLEQSGPIASNGCDLHGVSFFATQRNLVLDQTDSVFVTNCHMVGAPVGIDIPTGGFGPPVLSNCHIEQHTTAGVRSAATVRVLNTNFFRDPGGTDILLTGGIASLIMGNLLQGNVTIEAGASYTRFVGNQGTGSGVFTDGGVRTLILGNAGTGPVSNEGALRDSMSLTSKDASAGEVLTVNANSAVSGAWGMGVYGAGSGQDVFLRLHNAILAGNTSGGALRMKDGVGGTTWATFGAFGVELPEISDPSAPTSNNGRLYMRDNGSGKTQLCVRFPTGAIQVIATEP